ncbi:MAG: Ig family protein [Meiothermus sp.]|nr:Ig family protein [Meiothermus sp.]
MPTTLRRRAAHGIALVALSLLLASCGSSTQGGASREALRFNPTLPPAYIDDRYEYALVADGGQRPYRFTLNGTLPKGLTYGGGRISGTPTEKGSFELNATVEDGNLSSRAVKLTLTVSDTPPPQFDQFVPTAEQDSPFVYGVRIRARESRGFQMQVPLTDLRPTLDTLKAADGVLYVVRYSEERNVMDVDVAFTQPRTNFEALRLSIAPLPDKKVRFASTNVLMALYDKNGKLVANFRPMERQTTQGRFKYEDLQALARNWGRGVASQSPAGQSEPPAQAPTNQSSPAQPTPPATPEGQGTPPATANPATPASPEPANSAAPAGPSEQGQPTPPALGQPTPPAQGQPEQPAQGQPNQPAQGQPSPPAQGQPTQPAQAQPVQPEQAQPASPSQTPSTTAPAQPPQGQPAAATQNQATNPATQAQPAQSPAGDRLEGDLTGDGKVDQQDLEALRASYAWANVGNPTPRPNPTQNQSNPNPQTPQNQQNQNPPGGTGTPNNSNDPDPPEENRP